MSHAGTLFSIYQKHLTRTPDAIMLVQDGQTVSYLQFDRQVQATTDWLMKQGIQPGDHVAVWLINRIEWLVLLFALARIGATLVAVNTKYRAHELQYILTNSQATTLILQLNFKKIDFAAVVKDVDPEALRHLQRVIMLDADTSTPTHLLGRPVVAFSVTDAKVTADVNADVTTATPITPTKRSPSMDPAHWQTKTWRSLRPRGQRRDPSSSCTPNARSASMPDMLPQATDSVSLAISCLRHSHFAESSA